tara:strand:+ start:275 stop:484 length:210 start_codon:yes stop_codon:yes gene_type:complete
MKCKCTKTKDPTGDCDGSHAEPSRYNLIDTETGAIQESNVSINSKDVSKLNDAYSLNGVTKKWVTQLNG